MMIIIINLSEAKNLVEAFGGDEDLVLTLVNGDESFNEGPGLYAHDEYPEHGCIFLSSGETWEHCLNHKLEDNKKG